MFRYLHNKSLHYSAAFTAGLVFFSGEAGAQRFTTGSGRANFSTISENITDSIAGLPGLITGVSYLLGLMLGVLGILKVKDHVENPSNAKLSDGAIRFAAGGALFGLPIIYEAMSNTIGVSNNLVEAAPLRRVEFNVR